jgi:3-dehydroquinate dehydratase
VHLFVSKQILARRPTELGDDAAKTAAAAVRRLQAVQSQLNVSLPDEVHNNRQFPERNPVIIACGAVCSGSNALKDAINACMCDSLSVCNARTYSWRDDDG